MDAYKQFSPVGQIVSLLGPIDNKEFFKQKVLKSKNPQNYDEDDFETYMAARMAGEIDAYGNPIRKGDGPDQPIIPIIPEVASTMDQIDQETLTPVQQVIADRGIARAFAAEGGIMDLDTGRQMYGLGMIG